MNEVIDCSKCIVMDCQFNSLIPKKSCSMFKPYMTTIEAEIRADERAKVLDNLVAKLESDMPSSLDGKERYGYTVALSVVMEQLKMQSEV